MNIRLLGAVCVIVGCGGWGFLAAGQYIQRIRLLRQLVLLVDYMECELQYRATALPQLCRQAAEQGCGKLYDLFMLLSEELDAQISPNATCCMAAALSRCTGIPQEVTGILHEMGASLGKFDMHGQLVGLAAARERCTLALEELERSANTKTRSLQTLGLCAGAAIVILFL